MMAEFLRENEEEGTEEGQREAPGDRGRPTDHSDRTETELFPCSPRSPSSIQAAVKETRTTSQSDNLQESRQPEISVVSTEPLSNNNWFPGPSVVFTPQSGWSASVRSVPQPPPSYDQVIQEKTQEEHIIKPTAAPRRSTCTTTSATQTDQPCTAASTPALKRSASEKPQKPPRLSLSKAVDRKAVTETVGKATANTSIFTNPEDQRGTKRDIRELEKTDFSHTHNRSVTVFWEIHKNRCPAAPTETAALTSENGQRPVPRPRTKPQKQTTKPEIKVLAEPSPFTQPDSKEVFTKTFSDELEIFDKGDQFAERFDERLSQTTQVGDAVAEMSDPYSQRNIRARIQAFEGQNGTEEGNESARPKPLARRATTKPPVATKPSLPSRSVDDSQNIPATPTPKPAPKPTPLRKPVGMSVREQLEALHSNGSFQQRPIPPLPVRANGIHEEETSPTPPVPPMKPFKEPLKPNQNINNHNSISMSREGDFVDTPSYGIPVKSQYNVDTNGSPLPRQNRATRPTTIRVPSKMPSISDNLQSEPPPPLPFRKPIGSLNTPEDYQQRPKPAMSLQYSMGPEPSLPPRKPTMNRPLPPRPLSGKVGPGRPPPPKFGTNRAPSISVQPPPRPQGQDPSKREMVLPPRPRPGHCLYNKYILELPHGIAALDYEGCNIGELSFEKDEVLLLLEQVNNNEFQCQTGELIGRVHSSHLKIITPLDSYSSPIYDDVPEAPGEKDSYGLKVKAIYDFQPQNPEELTLRAGDVVTGVEQADHQWYRGTCRGSTGFFPVSYAEVLSSPLIPEKKEKPLPAPVSGPRCVARFDFEGEHSDELTFFEGDVIQLHEYVGEEWARGQVGASVGIFPLNFVEVVEDLPPPPRQQINQTFAPGIAAAAAAVATASPSIQAKAAKPAKTFKSKEEWAVALYDYAAKTSSDLSFRQGDRILITKHLDEKWSCGKMNGREGMFPRIYVQTTTEPSIDPISEAVGGMRARALYDFNSDCEEELSIQVGDILTNVESIDEEWFLADLRGRRALVPKNYVQVL
ncbi:SH3 domain-containing protein 19 isoform X2 [Oryzias melastigma]|uniref:SH3 domain-containing protein 19 isoform X2 n=1 Tax=Oryzias melastigma TaxID=30732 RepID=UPI00168D01E1|nr:SH3 domain-containing protein 19 isoform X2 [Oryzias melastigma]